MVQTVGERVRQLRVERDLSLSELARLAGIDRPFLGRIEQGEREPSLTTIGKLARALEVPPSALLDVLDEEVSQ